MGEYKDNVPVQAGEFIVVENGEAHIIGWIEDWPDAPAGSSGLRLIEVGGCFLSEKDIQKAGEYGGFESFESECSRRITEGAFGQGDFDFDLKDGYRPIPFADFVKHHPDGMYFVFEAPRMSYGLSAQIMDEWKTWKRKTGNPHPSADVALAWISGAFADAHPELDFASMRDEVFTMISCEEEGGAEPPQHPFVGRRLAILSMKGEPGYAGREGTVTGVDDAGQIHGTWGGCAIVPGEDKFKWLDIDYDHYNDGVIDVRVIQDFTLIVFVGSDGKSKTVSFDSWHFSPKDLLDAYRSMIDPQWNEDVEELVGNYRKYLLSTGCSEEDLAD